MRFHAITISTFAIFASASFASAAASAASVPCESLATLALPDTTITIAAAVPAGAFDPPGATPPIDTAACRVAGSIKPTSDSNIQFEVWMPLAGWNGKFLSAGEGGYAGAINYGGIADALRRGCRRSRKPHPARNRIASSRSSRCTHGASCLGPVSP